MAKIEGITVTLINSVEVGRDEFNHPVYIEKRVKVENVLVAPANTTEIAEVYNLTGKKAVYNIAIPKGDEHIWKDQKIEFFGNIWKVIGFQQEGISDNIPLNWNQKWMVARYE